MSALPTLFISCQRQTEIIHYSLFTIHSQPGRKFGTLSNLRPPFLFLPAGEKETRRARCKGKRGAGMQVKMDPCSYKLVFVLCGKRMQVWCKPECPTLLFPLPLPWCALYPWLPLWGSWHGVAVTEGASTGPASCAPGGLDPRRGPKPPALAVLRG